MTKRSNSLVIAYFFSMIFFVLSAHGQDADDRLKKMIVSEGGSSSNVAISIALKGEKADVLVFAMNNPSWTRKSEAVEAVGKLPAVKRDSALLEILSEKELWAKRVKGGRGQIMQSNFEERMKKVLATRLGPDVMQADLFDATVRGKLVANLQSGAR